MPELAPPEVFELSEREIDRESLFEQLDRQTGIVLDAQRQLEQLGPEMSDEQFTDAVDEMLAEIHSQVDATTLERVAQIEQLEQQRTQLYARTEYLRHASPEEKELESKLYAETQQLLRQGGDTRFVLNVHGTAKAWIQKHAQTRKIAAAQRDWLNEITITEENGDELHLRPNQVIGMRFTGIGASAILSSQEYDRVLGSESNGSHFAGSPISFIRQRSGEDTEMTLRHESMHNFLDGASDIGRFKDDKIDWHLRQSINISQIYEEERRPSILRREINKLDVDELLDALHHELLAGLERVERTVFPKDIPQEDGIAWVNTFFHYVENYSSAGWQALQTIQQLEALEKNSTLPPEVQRIATDMQFRFTRRFAEVVETIRETVERAQQLGPEVSDQLHALFIVLPPSKYRHCRRFLDRFEGPNHQAAKMV